MPEATLSAFGYHGEVVDLMPTKGRAAKQTLASFAEVGIDHLALAGQLQREGTESFDASWKSLLASIAAKGDKTGRQRPIEPSPR